jgi:N-acetylglutamate synthase-like GNAT family acetyltransferase
MEIRDATPDDTDQIADCLRRSITELCVEDHHDDPAILDRWLENKTTRQVGEWLSYPTWSMLVAVEQGRVIAVGYVSHAGEIAMNYVLPDARFRGISRSMVRAMEARAREHGAEKFFVVSTTTARRFYVSNGYRPEEWRERVRYDVGTVDYPMVKG